MGDLDPVRRPIDQIVTHKALPEYNEPEWVTELVEAGELPPLEERLPAEPMVWLEAAMEDGIGVYGDGHHAFGQPDGLGNVMAGVSRAGSASLTPTATTL